MVTSRKDLRPVHALNAPIFGTDSHILQRKKGSATKREGKKTQKDSCGILENTTTITENNETLALVVDIGTIQTKQPKKLARAKISNPGGVRRAQKRYYDKNVAKRRENTKDWRLKNPDKAKDGWSQWAKANPEKVKAKSHRRRARIAGAGGSFTKDDLHRIYKMQKGKCAYCKEVLRGKYQIDHIISIKNGGTNEAKNIQLLYHKKGGGCNQMKNSKDPIDFARSLGLLL